MNFKASRIAAALIHMKCGDSAALLIDKCTGLKREDLDEECEWLSGILPFLEDDTKAGRIAYLGGSKDPDLLSTEEFDVLVDKHKKALTFLINLIKSEKL